MGCLIYQSFKERVIVILIIFAIGAAEGEASLSSDEDYPLDTTLDNDFIAVLNVRQRNQETHFQSLVKEIEATFPNIHIVKTFKIGVFTAIRLKTKNDVPLNVSSHPDVSSVHANRRVYALPRAFQLRYEQPQPENAGVADDLNNTCTTQTTSTGLWGLARISQRQILSNSYTYGTEDGAGVDVYVLDTGVKLDHVELEGRATHGFTSTSIYDFDRSDDDLNGHGTHLAGTIAGRTFGTAKKARIISVKVLNKDGSGSTSDIIAGIEFIYQDIEAKRKKAGKKTKSVVNVSFGGQALEVGGPDEAAIVAASSEGIPFVIAAGNSDQDACIFSPARLSVAITVAASDPLDQLASFSNHGPCVDIIAPGVMILSSSIGMDTNATKILSGTSMAAPLVAGIVARLLSQQSEMITPASVKAWLINSATRNAIGLRSSLATSNALLYMACWADSENTAAPIYVPRTYQDCSLVLHNIEYQGTAGVDKQPIKKDIDDRSQCLYLPRSTYVRLLNVNEMWMVTKICLILLLVLTLIVLISVLCTAKSVSRLLNEVLSIRSVDIRHKNASHHGSSGPPQTPAAGEKTRLLG